MDERTELRVGLNLAISAIRKVSAGQSVDLGMIVLELEQICNAAEERAEFKDRLNCILQLSSRTQQNHSPFEPGSDDSTSTFSIPKRHSDSTKSLDNSTIWPTMELL